MAGTLILLLIFGLVLLLIFIFCRELTLWYFRINEMVALQTEMVDQLKWIGQSIKYQNEIKFNQIKAPRPEDDGALPHPGGRLPLTHRPAKHIVPGTP